MPQSNAHPVVIRVAPKGTSPRARVPHPQAAATIPMDRRNRRTCQYLTAADAKHRAPRLASSAVLSLSSCGSNSDDPSDDFRTRLLFLLCSNAGASDRPASWRTPSAKQMEKPLFEAVGSIPLARAFGPSDDMPTEYWDAVLRSSCEARRRREARECFGMPAKRQTLG